MHAVQSNECCPYGCKVKTKLQGVLLVGWCTAVKAHNL